MISSVYKSILFVFFVFIGCTDNNAQKKGSEIDDFNRFSEQFLQTIKEGKDTQHFQDQLANAKFEALVKDLDTDSKKLAFWVNIYNSYIQVILTENPGLYKNRQAFFNDDSIDVAGEKVAFGLIEHGIIRKSQWSLGLGRIRKLFPSKFERKLRVNQPDYRIHFALNCGAKDCPPVAIYTADNVKEQFRKGTAMYLAETTEYNPATKTVSVSSLFSWFRGDFGGKGGTRKILREQKLIPYSKDIEISYKNYDWTLDLDNWIEIKD